MARFMAEFKTSSAVPGRAEVIPFGTVLHRTEGDKYAIESLLTPWLDVHLMGYE